MKFNRFFIFLLTTVSIFLASVSLSQQYADTSQLEKPVAVNDTCIQKDIMDVIWKNRKKKTGSDKRVSIIGLPYIGYTPVTSFLLGIGGIISWRMGDTRLTKMSAASVDAAVTLHHQVMLQITSNVYTNQNKWFLQGEWRYYIYHLSTFGLGTMRGNVVPPVPGFPADSVRVYDVDDGYPMRFRWVEFHQFFSRKIIPNLYAGLGYQLDYHGAIDDIKLRLTPPGQVITPHYSYCIQHGFNPSYYTSSGLSINCVYDTRDNIVNPYRGFFVHVNYRYNFTWLGSSRQGSQLWTSFRTYIGLSKRVPRHLIALWFFGNFLISGEISYLDLQTTGSDQMNTSGRGYVQGRWRGENFIYGEAEYRFPISKCSGILGGVVFVNATTASSKDLQIPLFGGIRAAAGAGLRVMLAKRDRINLLIDFAVGQESTGAYILTQEAF